MSKICECGGIMNYDPYFKANICNTCGRMERIARNVNVFKCEAVQTSPGTKTKMDTVHFISNGNAAVGYVFNKIN